MTPPLPPIPAHLYPDPTKSLNVRVPAERHWEFKTVTASQGRDMASIVAALLTVYTRNPSRTENLIERADKHGVTLGEFLHTVLDAFEAKS